MRALFKNFHVVVMGFCVGSMWGLFVASGPESVRSGLRWASPPEPPPAPWCIHVERHDLRVLTESPDELLVVDGPRSFFVPTSVFDPETGDPNWRGWGLGYAPYRRSPPPPARFGEVGAGRPARALGDPPEAQ